MLEKILNLKDYEKYNKQINVIPDLDIDLFYKYLKQFKDRDVENLKDEKLLNLFLEITYLLPYYEGFEEYLNSNMPNTVIFNYINYGLKYEEAELLYNNFIFEV